MTASILKDIQPNYKIRHAALASDPTILADIYQEEVNIVVWRRQPSQDLLTVVEQLITAKPEFKLSVNANPRQLPDYINNLLGKLKTDIPMINLLVEDIVNIVSMFSCLFDLESIGFRLTVLDKAMCPKFHVDRIPARLVTTYGGIGTQWLPHECVDRNMLGLGSKGQEDHESGIYLRGTDIQHLDTGDVAILKGELWEGNEQAGLVHRSPAVKAGESRLLLTLDFVPRTLQ